MSIQKAQTFIWMRLSLNKTIKDSSQHLARDKKGASHKLCMPVACAFLCLLCLMGAAPKSPPKIYVKRLSNGNYQLIVSKKPYIIKGVCYNPVPIGQGHTYDWWSDPNKPWIIDGKLMKEMGVNTVRIYQTGENPENVKKVIRDLYNLYGIRVLLGHWLGFWEYPCPFYGDKKFQDKVKAEVLEMVNNYKDEPGVLFWILGNENNYSCLGQVRPWSTDEIDKEPDPQKQKALRAQIYYSYVNEIARQIHLVDQSHPVAMGNGELIGLEFANLFCPDIDIVACIIYRGKTFGNLFNSLRATFDKPLVISEFGSDAYDAFLKKEDQNQQAFFLESQWRIIYENLANNAKGAGNCLGGTLFEWTDEWWKHDEADPESWGIQDIDSNWSNGSYYFDIKAEGNKNMNEEWFGIVSLSPNEMEQGLHKRIPRKAYYLIREFWNDPTAKSNTKYPAPKLKWKR